MNRGSLYRRRSSTAFYGASFVYQNRRASNIQVPITLGLQNNNYIDQLNDSTANSYQNDNYSGLDLEGRHIRDCIESRDASKKLNYERLLATIVLCYGNFCVGSTYSVLGPLFPTLGKLKGISETWIGMIMSQYEVAIFIGSIIFGKLIPYFNPKMALICGLLIAGLTSLLFGFLQAAPSGPIFTIACMVLRTIEGLGAAMFFISAWTIVGLRYPASLARIFSLTEMFYAVGMIFGPGIGGLLSELGGWFGIEFILPFEALGVLIILGGLLAYFLIKHEEKVETNNEKTSILTIVKDFDFSINLLITINGCILIGFNDATLDLHLKSIQHLSPSLEGAIFVVQGAFYAMFNPYWASLVDKVANKHSLCIAGCIFSMLNYIITGPLPFIPINPNLWLIIIGQICLGFAMGGLIVGSFTHGFQQILDKGFPENVSTFAVISASFSSAFALGSALGPAIGGYLMGNLGYRWATLPMVALEFLFISGIVAFNLCGNHKKPDNSETNSYNVNYNTNCVSNCMQNTKIDEYIEMQ